MWRRHFLAGIGATLARGQTRRPNIVLIVADDLGYGELGCQGNPQIPTPNIDRIARSGVRFTNGYVTAPFCSPSRAGLLTGRYQTRFGHELNPVGRQNLLPHVGLPAREKSMAHYMRELGYRTALIGKWHLGGAPEFHPLNRGFDEFFGFLHEGHFYVPPSNKRMVEHLRPKEPPYDEHNPMMRGREEIEEQRYLTTAFGGEAGAFIERNASRPFFLYAPFNSVHSPMQSEPPDVDRFSHIADPHRRVFAGMLSSLDKAVGSILQALRKNRLERDTMVVFLSDNGGPVKELTSSNGPLRGQKGQLYEGGIRVPFALQWPARIRANQTLTTPVISLDLLPTILAAAGGRPAGNVDGMNLLPHLADSRKPLTRGPLYWRYNASGALRHGRWKIVRQVGHGAKPGPWQLFDLEADLGEQNDLAAKEPQRLGELLTAWERMNHEMVPPTPLSSAAAMQ
ncbi:MAG: sulfatase-like hydrolase/transferase [Bryobacteraceae bacterium]|nr:sulfatase-like hydrolase/transferase [Bryobacteraceae bacterium]